MLIYCPNCRIKDYENFTRFINIATENNDNDDILECHECGKRYKIKLEEV